MGSGSKSQSFVPILILVVLVGAVGYFIGIIQNGWHRESFVLKLDYGKDFAKLVERLDVLENEMADQNRIVEDLVEQFSRILQESIQTQTTIVAKLDHLEHNWEERWRILQLTSQKEQTVPAMANVASITYTVKSGDTVWDIAKWSKGNRNILEQVDLILNYNRITQPKLLRPGQELIVPLE